MHFVRGSFASFGYERGEAVRTEILIVLGIAVAIGVAIALLRSSRSTEANATAADTVFVFVKVPESIMPIDRGEKYEDPLDAALKQEKLGEVTGGGSQLSEPDAEGRRSVEWVGLDVELTELARGIPFLKKQLLRLGAPAGTTLEFQREGNQVVEPLTV